MIKYIFIAGIISIQLIISPSIQAQKIPLQVTDMLQITRATDIELSADGKYVLFTRNSIVPDTVKRVPSGRGSNNRGQEKRAESTLEIEHPYTKDYIYKRELWLADMTANPLFRKLDEKGEGITQPVFSPSGKEIAFIRNVKGVSQIFLYNLSSGNIRQLTQLKYGASNIKWSPDGKRIAYVSTFSLPEYIKEYDNISNGKLADWRKENQKLIKSVMQSKVIADPNGNDEAIQAYLEGNEKDQKAKVIARNSTHQEEDNFSANSRISHIFIIDTISAAVPRELTNGLISFSNLLFAGNNKLLVNVRGIGDLADNPAADELAFSSVFSIQADGSGFQAILSSTKESYSVASASPSGDWFAFRRSIPGTVNVTKTFVKDFKSEDGKTYPITIDRTINKIKFAPSDKEIYFVSQENGGSVLYRGNWVTNKYKQLSLEDEGITDFDLQQNTMVYAKTTAQNPSELFAAAADGKHEHRLTTLNTTWLENRKLSLPEKHSFKNELGLDIEYWIVKPIDFDPNKKYPLLLEMHGGPASMWGPGDPGMWHEFQYFAGKGIGIVYGNPRGSAGYGETFLRANKSDWAKGPAKDVLTYLDKTVAQGWVDSSKLLISGGSYAGYLTTWILAHDKRFLAASSQRGVYDFKTFLGEGRVWHIIPRYYDGYPWTPNVGSLLEQDSPINYVENINTPLLIFIGENDTQVGVSQSDMLYRSLKLLGKPVEYVRHPGAGHEVTRSGDNRQRIDQMLRTYDFFNRHLSKQNH